jgi:hypothetical protein
MTAEEEKERCRGVYFYAAATSSNQNRLATAQTSVRPLTLSTLDPKSRKSPAGFITLTHVRTVDIELLSFPESQNSGCLLRRPLTLRHPSCPSRNGHD